MPSEVIGREPELAILTRFLESIPTGPSALLLSGDPGIGKTTVWKEGLADALARDYRILSCGPIEAETRLSYTALGDLLEPILEEALPSLPEPQRRALEIALLRVAPSGTLPKAIFRPSGDQTGSLSRPRSGVSRSTVPRSTSRIHTSYSPPVS